MTTALVVSAASISAVAGMYFEYYTGRFTHFMRHFSKCKQATAQPRAHDAFIDDCEQFNHEMLRLEVSRRLFESSETIQ